MVVNPAFDLSQTTTAAPSSNSSRSPSPQLRSADLDQLRWAPLPGTQKEGEAIAQLTDAVLLAQQQASAAAVQQSIAENLVYLQRLSTDELLAQRYKRWIGIGRDE